MIKNLFGLHVIFCVVGAQGLNLLHQFYGGMAPHDRDFYLGALFCACAIIVAPFVLMSAPTGASPSPDTPSTTDGLTENENRTLRIFISFSSLVVFMMTPFTLLNQSDPATPLWWKATSIAHLFVSFFALRQMWTAYFRARRIIRERGFAPQEAKNGMA